MSPPTAPMPRARLKVAFVVQGEGRGHMTQALALADALGKAGHELPGVFLGVNRAHPVPAYFQEGLPVAVTPFTAPAQIPGRSQRGVSVATTIVASALGVPNYLLSAMRIQVAMERLDLDVVVSFMDVVSGYGRAVWRPRVPAVVVGHNYLIQHPDVGPLPGSTVAQNAVLGYLRMTSMGAALRLALSYRPFPDYPGKDIRVVPPLLRPELSSVKPRDDGHITAYALNRGYADVLARRHAAAAAPPPMHCFVEGGPAALSHPAHPGFQAFDLDDRAFLDSLGRCTAYVGSAGFESLCEAHYLGKPILAVPTEHQWEQELNAWDAERHGVAQAGDYCDLGTFLADLPTPDADDVATFRSWVDGGPDTVVSILEEVAATARR